MKGLGNALIAVGGILGLVGLMWLVTNLVSGILQAGGFILGLFFMLLFVLPVVAVGFYLRGRDREEVVSEAAFEGKRRLLERDRMVRQTMSRQAARAAEALKESARSATGEASELLRQAASALDGLAQDAASPVSEADWLHATDLTPQDANDVARYDDLLLAALGRIQQEAARGSADELDGSRQLAELAQSAARQFSLRQDLVLRGRRLPAVSPLNLIRGMTLSRTDIRPESLGPGGAVSRFDANYLVTARISYFEGGRTWYALALRGEDGESRLQTEPGSDRALFLRPESGRTPPASPAAAGTASVSIESLSGSAEGVIVEYSRTSNGAVHLWERWPDGEKNYTGEWVSLSELEFWPAAVGGQAAV